MSELLTQAGAVSLVQAAAGLLFILVLFRVAAILGTEPANEMLPELVYLRGDALRTPVILGLLLLLVSAVASWYPLLSRLGYLTWTGGTFYTYLGVIQGVLLAVVGLAVLRVARVYSRHGFDLRLKDNLQRLTSDVLRQKK